MVSWQDPQIYLKSLTTSNNKVSHFDIVDYVDNSSLSQTERVLSNNEDGQLIFKSGPSKPKLENINLSQWSIANLAIMHKLLEQQYLSQGQILDYLSYTTRVYQLIATHETRSVLFYDREYRRLQHLHKFRWGTDVPHIQTVYLKPRHLAQNAQQVQTSKPNTYKSAQAGSNDQFPPRASHTAQGLEICKRFNSRKGCAVRQCRFAHACSVPGCSDNHAAFAHVSKNH